MDIYIKEDRAFVDIGNGYMLCIGSKDNVKDATDEQIAEMVRLAVVYNRFLGIESKGQAIN